MDDLAADLDLDIWRYGRNAATAGRLDNKMLRACYPYVELAAFPNVFKNEPKILNILKEHFERDHNDIYPFLVRSDYVFFQEREQAELFKGLLYIY